MIKRGKRIIKRILRMDRPISLDDSYSYPPECKERRIFYGQYGEDIKISELFKNKKEPGFFVEVGAMEGIRFSNTYLFEKKGWKGICIEPHPFYFNLLEKNRRGSICVHAAAGKEDKDTTTFYSNFRGSMSTLDKELEGFFRSHYGRFFGGFKEIEVPLITLNSILEKNHIGGAIDILSIDTEGTETDVLRGFDFEKFSPRVVIAEISIRKEPVMEYLKNQGYTLSCTNPSNAIFCRDREDAEVIRLMNVVGKQIVPGHPLEENEK